MTSEQIKKLAAAGLTIEQIAAVAEVMEAPRQATPEEVMYHIHSAPPPSKPPMYFPPGVRGAVLRGDSMGSHHIENGHWVCDSPPVAADGTVLESPLHGLPCCP